MIFYDLLKMTKAKIIVLILFMIFLAPSYTDLSCINGFCTTGKELCSCGFLPIEFFVTFVWMYVFACIIIEIAELIKKQIK